MASPAAQELFAQLGPGSTRAQDASGRPLTLADLSRPTGEPAPSRSDNTVQTDRWPLPGSGDLHPLDKIQIAGVWLPLESMPTGSAELDVSERKQPGSDYSTFVSHGAKSTPVQIRLKLFRDEALGWKDGMLVGKDWLAEWRKVSSKLLAKNLGKDQAVPVYYPTLQARGVTSLIFTKITDLQRTNARFFTVELEGRDPRTVRRGGGSKKVKQAKDFGTRGNPIPPAQQADKAPSKAAKKK